MKNNLITTTKDSKLALNKTKSLLSLTKKILASNTTELSPKKENKALILHKDITIIGDLIWEKKSRQMILDDALIYAKNLRLGGYNDWRLPSEDELAVIVLNFGRVLNNFEKNLLNEAYHACYKEQGFKSHYNWSSTTYVGHISSKWYLGFGGGYQYGYRTTNSYYMRCVRG